MIGPQLLLANSRAVFISHFGISPLVCAVTWYLIRTHVMKNEKLYPSFLLWTLHFLKNYTTLEVLRSAIPEKPDTGTISSKIWIMIEKISLLGDIVIVFDRRFEGNTPYRSKMTIDGTDFQIRQPSLKTREIKNLNYADKNKYSRSWYSHKFKGPGLRYEVGICIFNGNICWINGPFRPGLMNDISIFRQKLRDCLKPGEQVIADKGYRGDPLFARVPDSENDTPEEKKYNSDARMRQEHVNHYFKTWQILKQVFRHDRDSHCMVFWSVAVLTQISFDMKDKKTWQVDFVGETHEEARQYLLNNF